MTDQNLEQFVVRVIIPEDRESEFSAAHLPMSDHDGKARVRRARLDFHAAVMKSVQDFAASSQLGTEADFSSSGTNIVGFFFSCTENFASAAGAARIPYVGAFLRNKPMQVRPL